MKKPWFSAIAYLLVDVRILSVATDFFISAEPHAVSVAPHLHEPHDLLGLIDQLLTKQDLVRIVLRNLP